MLLIWAMQRNVVPTVFGTRSAIGSVIALELAGLLIEHQVVVAEVRTTHAYLS
jgi:hypothetical protein